MRSWITWLIFYLAMIFLKYGKTLQKFAVCYITVLDDFVGWCSLYWTQHNDVHAMIFTLILLFVVACLVVASILFCLPCYFVEKLMRLASVCHVIWLQHGSFVEKLALYEARMTCLNLYLKTHIRSSISSSSYHVGDSLIIFYFIYEYSDLLHRDRFHTSFISDCLIQLHV